MGIGEIFALCGIPSAITGFFFWLLKRQMTKQAKERETKDENREKLIISLIQTARASMAFSEATARAVQSNSIRRLESSRRRTAFPIRTKYMSGRN